MSESQGRAIAISVLSAALALLFLFAGAVEKLGRPDVAAERFVSHFGYPAWMALAIGLAETAGAVGLLVPRLAPFAAAGLSIVMLGAFASHLRVGDPLTHAAVPLVVLAALTALGLLRRHVRRAAATPA